jgi:hypothetical protein
LALLTLLSASCGGGDDADETVASATTTRAQGGSVATTVAASSASGATGKLPDACALIDDATAGAAMAGTVASKAASQPPTDSSATCMWAGGGVYSMTLLVRRGTSAKTSFDNVVSSGFAAATLAGAEARVNLGAPDTARDYRLVTFAAYNGVHFVNLTLQGRNRPDAAATDTAAGVARVALSKL